jgi:hypothetical protein
MIDSSKKYTSGGHPVEHLHRVPDGWPIPCTWRGFVNEKERTWTDDGKCFENRDSALDLIEVCEPLEFPLIVNSKSQPVSAIKLDPHYWDMSYPSEAPHRLVTFIEKQQ